MAFGDFGIQAVQPGWITAQQLEAARVVLSRFIGTEGRYWCRIFPHKSVTSIPLETRMGKGKGEPDFWAAVVKPGTVLYEIAGVPESAAKLCFRRLAHKMPVAVRFIKRRAM